jgi:biotin operon repressor
MSWRAVRWAIEDTQQANLSSVQRLVLLALAYHHNERGGACYPSNDTIQAETGLSRRAVQTAIKSLKLTGLITVSSRSVHGIQTSNQYDLFGRIEGRTTCTPRGAPHARGGAHEIGQQGRTTCTRTLTGADSDNNVTPFPSRIGGML